jgi:hypothetical protein
MLFDAENANNNLRFSAVFARNGRIRLAVFVAVTLLSERDLDALGTGFYRLFSIADDDDEDDAFAELLARLDKLSR